MSAPSFPINEEKLSKVIRSEFELWINNFGKGTVTEAQELRAFFIQWFAVFAPECFERPLVKEISTFAYEVKQHVKFSGCLWYELLPVEIALYALSLDSSWINIARANLNHHNSALRRLVLESLLLIVDKLHFDDPYLLDPITDNLKIWHGGSDETVLFLTMAQGDPETKQSQIRQWLDQVEMSPDDREKLQAYSNGEFIRNPFLHYIIPFACYVLLRLASQETILQLPLFPEIPENSERQISTTADDLQLTLPNIPVEEEPDLGTVIWQRMNDHPVFQPFIRFEQTQS